MSKSPYELRFDVLQMARELVEMRYNDRNNMAWSFVNDCQEKGKPLTREQIDKIVPPEISSQEIIEKAKELYEFVLDNS